MFFGVQLATSKDKVALEASGFWLANSMEKCGWAMGLLLMAEFLHQLIGSISHYL